MPKPGPEPKVTKEDVFRVFTERADASEPLTATEIAEVLNCSRPTAWKRLGALVEDGALKRKQVGARAAVYWIAEDNTSDHAPAEPLQGLAGILDNETADRARERSEAWRDQFDEDLGAGDA